MRTPILEGPFGALGLERRLLPSYAVAVAIFSVATVILHFVFVGILRDQMRSRLEDVARAGMRSVIRDGNALKIDRAEVSNGDLLRPGQSLQWLDSHGRLMAAQGVVARSSRALRPISASVPIYDRASSKPIGFVIASESQQQLQVDLGYVDTGLLAGALLAALVGVSGGVLLARRAVRPAQRSFEILREFTDNASHELRADR